MRENAAALPPLAKVLRHDDVQGTTRRIAVQFKTTETAELSNGREKPQDASAPISKVMPVAPPMP